MKTLLLLPGILAVSMCLAAGDSMITRSLPLKAGWNAVWLDVTPADTRVQAVTADLPLASIWTHQQRAPTTDFITNPSEPVWKRNEWLVHVPTNRIESLDNNLFHVFGDRAYLIELEADATWTVTGRPSARGAPWAANAWTLRGFPIDDAAPPTFRDYFRASPAHYDSASGTLTPVYRLGAAGEWERVLPSDLMQAGAAYWVYTSGSSRFNAPLEVDLETSSGQLDFGQAVVEKQIVLRNLHAAPVTATIEEILGPPTTALGHAFPGESSGTAREPLPPLLSREITPGGSRGIILAARRAEITGDSYESVLDVRDNAGTRYLIPVLILRAAPGSPGAGAAAARAALHGPRLHAQPPGVPHRGLWVGTATVRAVSEVHSGVFQTNSIGSDGVPLEIIQMPPSTNTRPVRAEYDLRLILHVDATGTTRMLKEVIQLWQEGETRIGADGVEEVITPGRMVLLTDETRIGQFHGASLRDGTLVGRRISSAAFDFPSTPTNNFLLLSGSFETNSTLSGAFTVFPGQPTNPFRHKYHPDHDNLDATYTDFRAEAFEIHRSFRLEITPEPPDGLSAPPGYGYDHVAGVYRETVTGLHREPIYASGTFRLRRVSLTDELDPPAQP